MKRTRHSAERIVTKLREAEAMLAAGRSVAQLVQLVQLVQHLGETTRWAENIGDADGACLPDSAIEPNRTCARGITVM
jgi:hypothetical protein